jgi:hypothetical protein
LNAPLPVIDPSLNRAPEIDKQPEEQIATNPNAYLLLEQQPQLLQHNVRYHINKLEESQGIRRGSPLVHPPVSVYWRRTGDGLPRIAPHGWP